MDLIQLLLSSFAPKDGAGIPPPPVRAPGGAPPLPPLPERNPVAPNRDFAIPNVHSNFDAQGQFTGPRPQPQAAGAPIPPLPTRRPEPAQPTDFALPNVHSNFDARTGRWNGGPLQAAGGAPEPGTPPLPIRRAEAAPPPLPGRRPEPGAPPLPERRPGTPQLPGTIVDNNAPGNIFFEFAKAFGGLPIAQGMTGPRVLDAVGGPAAGTPRPSITAPDPASRVASADPRDQIGPFETTVQPAQSGPDPKAVAAFFRSLARGMASADPTAPPLTAFGQGMSGALEGRRSEELADQKAQLAAEDREFERNMRTAENRRAEAREKREARKAEIMNTKAVTEIMRSLGGALTTDEKFKLEKQITDYAKAINPDGMMKEEDLKAALDEYRADLERRLGVRQEPAGGNAPAGGDGSSREKPARPMTRQAFAALPSGAWFVNPADGRILQKK